MKSKLLWIGLGVAISGLFLCLLMGRTGTEKSTVAARPVVYLNRQTRQLVVAPPQPIDSNTGRPSRVRALYCSRCVRWYAVPPPYPGNPRSFSCPRHHLPMSDDGPISSNPQTSERRR